MADDNSRKHDPIDETKPKAHHENHDREVGAIIEVAIGAILLTAASIFVLIELLPHLEIRVSASQSSPAGASIDARKLPPEPRLQDNAVQDLQQMRTVEDLTLSSYAWVDQKKGVVRIPIDRAVELLAQRGLPVRAVHGTPNSIANGGTPAEAGPASKVQ